MAVQTFQKRQAKPPPQRFALALAAGISAALLFTLILTAILVATSRLKYLVPDFVTA
eukprot:CAMPEP_0184732756 /NCGR_PEP_ID=MMETSP0314-20130426/55347_1 /TAXON_ID=38298 /ORGANISM="Rhodella maculata, Strain CCMP 736" /LENGTH=56 /DNA_ID=CAMNT_0027199413 /DNA_START=41 /DNA_END=207 /DNA_ORIENTATION=-